MAEDGKPKPFVMGCYGIGVSRTAQAAVEQNHDDKGICWPAPVAPFECAVVLVDPKRAEQVELAERIYAELRTAGVDACLDDRPMRPGPKFKDLELLGFPYTVTVGRGAPDGVVEFSVRQEGGKAELPVNDAIARVRAALGR